MTQQWINHLGYCFQQGLINQLNGWQWNSSIQIWVTSMYHLYMQCISVYIRSVHLHVTMTVEHMYTNLSKTQRQKANIQRIIKYDHFIIYTYNVSFLISDQSIHILLLWQWSTCTCNHCNVSSNMTVIHKMYNFLDQISPFIYRQVTNISRTLVGYKIVDHSDVVGASPVGAAPNTSSFST